MADTQQNAGDDPEVPAAVHRIDTDHGPQTARPSGDRRSPRMSSTRVRRPPMRSANDDVADIQALPADDERESERRRWLRLHASDLIERIQHWSDSVDTRESILNARAAQQDRRERQFRLQQQDLAVDLHEQRRSIERLRRNLETQARRLAFLDTDR